MIYLIARSIVSAAGDEVAGRVDAVAIRAAGDLPGGGVDEADALDLVAEEIDADDDLLVRRARSRCTSPLTRNIPRASAMSLRVNCMSTEPPQDLASGRRTRPRISDSVAFSYSSGEPRP